MFSILWNGEVNAVEDGGKITMVAQKATAVVPNAGPSNPKRPLGAEKSVKKKMLNIKLRGL